MVTFAVVVSGRGFKAAVEVLELAINSGGLLSFCLVSVRCDRIVAPAVGGGTCTVLPTVGGVSERDDAADVTAL